MLHGASLVTQTVKDPPAMQGTHVPSLGWEDPLEKAIAIHSSVLSCRIPWTEEPCGLQSIGLQRVKLTEQLALSVYINWIRNYAHTPPKGDNLRQHLAPSSRSLCYVASSFSNLDVVPCFLVICKLNSKTKANQSPSSPQIPGSPHVPYTVAKQRQNNTLETSILQMEYWETPSFLWSTH